jgi:putative methionine-R-sulfoxide reductase with GAF domain
MSSESERAPEKSIRRIEAIVDAALGRLDIEDLLEELLEQVLELLEADTAAVLLLDRASEELVARAACGIEEEIRQGVRVPLGRGFAGRIATEKRPILLDRVDETTVWNPILWEKGMRAMLGVPLLSGDEVLGVLHVGSLRERVFTVADVQALQFAAERVAAATQIGLLNAERAAARVLQASLIPAGLPACPGLEFAARYAPAEEGVGGDWYDVFMLPSERVWAVSGDVQGHGFRAAVVMGRIRSTIRAYAMEGRPPNEVIALTDRKLQHFEPDEMATVLCATFDPPYEQVQLSSAGHPPPVLAIPGRRSVLLDVELAPPLGVEADAPRSSDSLAIADGAVLLLYTDGLIERRGESLDVGLDRLCSAVTAEHPERLCHHVMARLIAGAQHEDDIAVLAIRRLAAQQSGPMPIAMR